jgi:hypothetical protein
MFIAVTLESRIPDAVCHQFHKKPVVGYFSSCILFYIESTDLRYSYLLMVRKLLLVETVAPIFVMAVSAAPTFCFSRGI